MQAQTRIIPPMVYIDSDLASPTQTLREWRVERDSRLPRRKRFTGFGLSLFSR